MGILAQEVLHVKCQHDIFYNLTNLVDTKIEKWLKIKPPSLPPSLKLRRPKKATDGQGEIPAFARPLPCFSKAEACGMSNKYNMQKDFDEWNTIKKKTHTEHSRLYTVREIWWCQFGVNIGTEQDGRGERFLRPAVILRGFGSDACMVVPLTTSEREHSLRVSVGEVDGKPARANLSQIRVIDTRRLIEKIGFMGKGIFSKTRKAAKDML